MCKQKLPSLQRLLQRSKDLGEVQDYFLTHFAEDEEFMALSQPVKHEFLEAVLKQVAVQMFGPEVIVLDILLLQVPEHRFIHGSSIVEGRCLTLFYFEEVPIGLMAVASLVPGVDTTFVRLKPLK
jgi:hypothetical protein